MSAKTTKTIAPAVLVATGLLLGSAGEALAQVPEAYSQVTSKVAASSAAQSYAPGELVVRYRSGTKRAAKVSVRRDLGAGLLEPTSMKGLEVLDLPAGTSVTEGVQLAQSLPQVEYAEPNFALSAAANPNDPMFNDMWSLGLASGNGQSSGIGTPRVWNLTTGSPNVTVAIVDSGVDGSHPDLAPNMWSNPGETPGNGTDDDSNGLVDDTRGWDWVASDSDPSDELGHGTHVAGIIGARGNNNLGVAGVSWDVRLMPLRVLDAAGSGWTSDVADAFAYAGSMGADVVNASLAGSSPSVAMLDAIAAYPDTLFVVAAGNSSQNVDATPQYPCVYTLPNVICVAATGRSNQLSSYSNFGAAAVDLAAPGDQILSTWPGGTYNDGWGTSFATPHVAGLAALLMARHPGASSVAVQNAIMLGTEPLGALAGRTVSGGRVSAAGAFEQMGDVVPNESKPQLQDDPRDGDGGSSAKRRCQAKRRRQDAKRPRHRSCSWRR